MPLVVRVLLAMLVVLVFAVVVSGFASGAWLGGLLYAGIGVLTVNEWVTLRRASNAEGRDSADRLFVGLYALLLLLARPALDSLETAIFG
jgi:hypothetical protein